MPFVGCRMDILNKSENPSRDLLQARWELVYNEGDSISYVGFEPTKNVDCRC